MAIDFKGYQYPKDVILYAVFFYVRYRVSYRDLEEIMEERGVDVDHSTLNRWVAVFVKQLLPIDRYGSTETENIIVLAHG